MASKGEDRVGDDEMCSASDEMENAGGKENLVGIASKPVGIAITTG